MEELTRPRDDKSTRFTLTVTAVFMVVLIVAAWLLKRNAADRGKPADNTAAAPAAAPKPSTANSLPGIPIGDDGAAKSEYEVITDCRLEDDPANDGDTFRVATPHGSRLFRLYWVQTVQINGASPEATREAMDHFGLKSEESLRDLAVEARDFTLNMLRSVHFRLVTRWEKDPVDGAWLCFAYALDTSTPQESLQNVALLLVRNGLALIRPCGRPLPEADLSAGDFQNQLTAAESEAKQSLSGGWARRNG
jgi:endonuclease YncB( thermonuclease family)